MKKIIKMFAGAVAALCILAGCSNVSLNEAYYTGSTQGKCVIKIGVDNIDAETLSSARQLQPGALSGFTKFTLEGISSTPGVASFSGSDAKTVNFGTETSTTVALDYAVWTLTLTAYKDFAGTTDTADDLPVLMGINTVDLTKEVPAGGISFTLTAGNIATNGGIALTATYTYTPATSYATIGKVVVGLYDRLDNSEIKNNAETPVTTKVELTGASIDGNISYSKDKLTPGNYKLAVTFYGSDGTTKIGYWSDMVIIAPGNTTTIELTIPDVIMKKPAAPENVYAYLVNSSEKDGTYKVRINWEDKSNNEENFIINVYEYETADATSGTLYKSLGVDTANPVDNITEPFFTSLSRVSGSIFAGNQEAVIYLPAGKLFDVKVQAQNFAGKSAEVARTEPSGDLSGFTKYTSTQKINRVLVSYNLNGGSLVTSTKTYVGGFYNEYFTYPETSGHTLLVIKTAETEYPRLTYNNHAFNGWRETLNADSAVTTYSGFANYTVYATFNLNVNISYTLGTYAAFVANEVTITKGSPATSVIGGSAALTDDITVTVTAATANAYDWYQIDLDGTPIYYGSTNTFTFKGDTIHGLTAGTKNIVVYARVAGTPDTWVAEDYTVTFGN